MFSDSGHFCGVLLHLAPLVMISNKHQESTAKGTLQTELKDEDHKGQVVKKPHHRRFIHGFNGDWLLSPKKRSKVVSEIWQFL